MILALWSGQLQKQLQAILTQIVCYQQGTFWTMNEREGIDVLKCVCIVKRALDKMSAILREIV